MILNVPGIGELSGGDHPHGNIWQQILSTPGLTWALEGDKLVASVLMTKAKIPALQKAVIAALGSIAAAGMDMPASLTSLLSHTWAIPGASTEPEEVCIVHAIPEAIHAVIHPWLRWSATEAGERVYLVRTSTDVSTWRVAEDPLGMLAALKLPSGDTLLDHIAKRVHEMQLSGETTWGVTSETDKVTGKTKKTIKSFAMLASQALEKLRDDIRFRINMPAAFSNDPDTPCHSYFPLEDFEEAPDPAECEHWLDFESQIADWAIPTWRAAFFGIFHAGNRSRQIMYLYDTGRTGKSNMIRAIANVSSGSFITAVSKDSLANQFWGSKIFGRRLVVFSDSGNTKISQMDKIKQITGGDPIDVEFKGGKSFPYIPNCRVIVTTNRRPEINIEEAHQLSRALVFPLTATTDPNILKKFCALDDEGNLRVDDDGNPIIVGSEFSEAQTDEFPAYLALCKPYYDRLCPNNQDVIVPPEMRAYLQGNCATATNDAVDMIFTMLLEQTDNPDDHVSNAELREILAHVSGSGAFRDTDLSFSDLRESMRIRGLRAAKPYREKGTVQRGWAGLRFREGVSVGAQGVVVRDVQPPMAKPEELE